MQLYRSKISFQIIQQDLISVSMATKDPKQWNLQYANHDRFWALNG